jgi:hypothetical protein
MAFVDRYLKCERRCYRWIPIPLKEVEVMYESGELIQRSGCHSEMDGQKAVEFHVDDHATFQGHTLTRFLVAWEAT